MAETGRSSTNLLKPPIRPWKCGFAFQTLTKGGLGERVRSIYIPEKGYEFLEVDLSQVEARFCCLLSNDLETLALFDKVDVHKFTYRKISNLPEDAEVTSQQRYLGKQGRYSYQYGTGPRTFMNTVNSDAKKYGIDLQISQGQADLILKSMDKAMPNIKKVFHKEVEEALLANHKILLSPILPFGPPVGRRRQFFDRFGADLLRQAYAQIPQSIPPDYIRRAYIFDIQPKLVQSNNTQNLLLCGEAHDALLFKSRLGFRAEAISILKTSLETEIDFSACSLPRGKIKIPVEIKVGQNYKDMEKVA